MSRSEYDAHQALRDTPPARRDRKATRKVVNVWPVLKGAAIIIILLIVWSILK